MLLPNVNLNEKTILVTGGCGFIGSSFIKYILKKYPKYKIINLDALTYCSNIENLNEISNNPNYKFIQGNICNKNLVKNILPNVNFIINFAAESCVDRSFKNPTIFTETNVKGVLNLLECIKNSNVEKFIQISTDEVYGSLGDKGLFCEKSPLAPNNPYAKSKAEADLITIDFFKEHNLPVIITRSSNNYGPYQNPEKFIPLIISKLLKEQKIPIYGNGQNIRDWIYVYDNCEAIDTVLHNGKIGEIYNIGANNEKTNIEIATSILKTFKKDKSYIKFDFALQLSSFRIFVVERAYLLSWFGLSETNLI